MLILFGEIVITEMICQSKDKNVHQMAYLMCLRRQIMCINQLVMLVD